MNRHAAVLARVIAQIDREQLTGAEVGVLRGETSAYLLRRFTGLCLYMVDMWRVSPKFEFRTLGRQCGRIFQEFEDFSATLAAESP
jgi:hypothetical protein